MNDFKNSINGFPIDNELKMLIANTVINKMESIGFEPTENTASWFANEVSETLVIEILESVVQWQAKKLN